MQSMPSDVESYSFCEDTVIAVTIENSKPYTTDYFLPES